MKGFKRIMAITILIINILIAGCGIVEIPDPGQYNNNLDEHTPTPPVKSGPVKGGSLSIAISRPDTLNPLLTKSKDTINFLGIIFESVVEYDESLKPQPALASDWEVLDGGKLWVFNIKKGIKWHDGQSLTAEDVLFTFEALRSGKLESFYEKNIADNPNIVEVGLKDGDPYSFYIQLEEPSALVLDLMTFPVVSHKIFKNVESMLAQKDDISTAPIGSGPYKVNKVDVSNGKKIILEKNKRWWNGEPYINNLTAKIYGNNESARTAFINNKVDVVDTMAFYADVMASPDNANLYRYPTHNYEFLAFNPQRKLLNDKNLRKAIALAIDRKEIISKVYLNSAEAVDVPILLRSWLYNGKYRVYDFDIEEAKALLAKSGWEDIDGDGFLDKNEGTTQLSFTLMTNDDNYLRRESAFMIARQLAKIGIKVDVRSVSWEELWEGDESIVTTHNYDVLLTGYYLDYAHDLSFAFHSREVGNGFNNFIEYENKTMDKFLDNARKAYKEEDRVRCYNDIQKHLVEQLPVVSLYFRTGSILANNKVHGIKAHWDLGVYQNIEDWYIVE